MAKDAGLSGLEFGLAIPGTVGGAVWANAGAHESDIASVLVNAGVIGADGTETTLDPDALGLAYRDSILKHAPDGRPDVVTQATFELVPEDPAVISARLDEIRRWRQAHQPLGMPSAGSIFRNPTGDSAGRLIDSLGLKGTRVGGASVSEKHANFLVNDQGGTAATCAAWATGCGRRVRERRTASSWQYEVVFTPATGPGWPVLVTDMRHPAHCRRRPSRCCSAGRPPSTTSRSCPAGPSRRRSPPAAIRWTAGSSTSMARWWQLPAAALDPAIPATAFDDPGALGAAGPVARPPPWSSSPPGTRRPSSSRPSTDRSARTAPSRRW